MISNVRCLVLLIFAINIINIGSLLLDDALRPFITPENETHTVKSSGDLILNCKGARPVNWSLPVSNTNALEWSNATIVNFNTTDDTNKYGSILTIRNVSFTDIGYYYCHYIGEPNLNNPFTSSSIYVFVKDEAHLSVHSNNEIFVTGVEYSFVQIPCNPTFPEVNVTLFRNGDPFESYENFDPKTGFNVFLDNSDVSFACSFTYLNKTIKNDVGIFFLEKVEGIEEPKIKSDRGEHVIEHENLTLTCEVFMAENTLFLISWDIPSKAGLLAGRIIISNTTLTFNQEHKRLVGKSILYIDSVAEEDEGSYTCKIEDHSQNFNNHSIFVQVHEKGFSFINLTEEYDSVITNFTIGEDEDTIKIKIEIDAYPPVETIWLNNKNVEIVFDLADEVILKHKYTIRTNPQYSLLEIHSLSFDDAGNYTLKAKNEFMEKEIVIGLQVFGKPSIIIVPGFENYFLLNKPTNISCDIQAYPMPDVFWTLRSCDNCSTVPLNETFNVIRISEVHFQIQQEFVFEKSGYLTCHANNSIGSSQYILPVTVSEIKNGFGIWNEEHEKTLAVGDDLSLICMAEKQNFTSDLKWLKKPTNSIENGIVRYNETRYSYVSSLKIENVTETDSGTYVCEVNEKFKMDEIGFDFLHEKRYSEVNVIVRNATEPTILATNMNGSDFRILLGQPLTLFCHIDGLPNPRLVWLKDSNEIEIDDFDRRITSLRDSRTNQFKLVFNYTKAEDEGIYECLASNKVGQASQSTNVYIKNKIFIDYTLLKIITGLFAAVFFILLAILCAKCHKEKKLKRELKIAGLANFEKGHIESLNPDLTVDEQADLLPYNKKKWEFPIEKLKLGKQLGSGAFGVVLKADAYGILENEQKTTVAVKMVKGVTDHSYIKALVSELKIMAHLGRHINVVNLLGAYTKNVMRREIFIIVEYCQFGNVRNFLIKNRQNFINQLNSDTDKFDYDLQWNGSSPRNSFRNNSQTREDTTASSNVPSIAYSPLLSTQNSQFSETETFSIATNYRGDYKKTDIGLIYSRHLTYWSFQIANGMEYLASRKVLHGDLAARNILLSADNIVKICDFGLAKSVYKTENYKKEGNSPLPLKWMAIESIRDRIFSVQSDVWSFGIVLWEIFSLANTPYPEKEVNSQFYCDLLNGYRMSKPVYATSQLYEIMQECWRHKPISRPSFLELVQKLKPIVHKEDLMSYSKISDVLIDEQKSNDENDYLKLLTAPDYRNICPSVDGSYLIPTALDRVTKTEPKSENTIEMVPLVAKIYSDTNHIVRRLDNHVDSNEPNYEDTKAMKIVNNGVDTKLNRYFYKPLIVTNPTYMSTFGNGPRLNDSKVIRNQNIYSFENNYVNSQTKDWERIFKS